MSTWIFEPGHTEAEFKARHMMVSWVRGLFKDIHGTLELDFDRCLEATFEGEIDATGIWTGQPQRDEHLRSADFFNVKEFPTMTFESTKVEKTGEKTAKLHGNVTLLGQTKPAVFDVTFNKIAPHPVPTYKGILTAGFSIRGTIKRTDWGMKLGVPALSDEIALYIEIESNEKK